MRCFNHEGLHKSHNWLLYLTNRSLIYSSVSIGQPHKSLLFMIDDMIGSCMVLNELEFYSANM